MALIILYYNVFQLSKNRATIRRSLATFPSTKRSVFP
jgi:hypothetical protein